jgi:lipopolysaccharide/colanic/teichoic acid biosynthesis glycosyltransferase
LNGARRLVDAAVSLAGLVVLSPLLLALAVLVKATSRGPVFYRGDRVGRGGRLFRVLKFRSMAESAGPRGPAITRTGDARVTRVGRYLRRFKLDELPQLVNVLIGDMSVVGPRPEDPKYVALYTPEQRQVLEVRPGLTSPASLRYAGEERLLVGEGWEQTYVSKVLPAKLRIDLDYLRRRSLWTDMAVIGATLVALIRPPRDPEG